MAGQDRIGIGPDSRRCADRTSADPIARGQGVAASLPAQVDVAVIGAGVQGLTTALYLAREGRDVLVLERGDPWREASGVNAGSLAIQNKRLPLVAVARAALEQWATWQRELGDIGFVP